MTRRLIDSLSLDGLRVFATCGRHMSFSAAARELMVTQAAVSRRIRLLEDALGYALFVRSGRYLAFTDKGAQLFHRTHDALDLIATTLDALSPGASRGHVSIAAGQSMSHLWLGPQLRRFASRFPDVPVQVLGSDNMDEVADDRNDLAILYCAGSHPGWMLTPLVAEELVPVAAPAYLAAAGLGTGPHDLSPAELSRLRLCDYDLANARWLNLQSWFRRIPGGTARITPAARYSTYMMALDAVLDGGGVMLGSRGLIAAHLDSGALVELSSHVLETGFGYHLGVPTRAAPRAEVQKLSGFLLSQRPATGGR